MLQPRVHMKYCISLVMHCAAVVKNEVFHWGHRGSWRWVKYIFHTGMWLKQGVNATAAEEGSQMLLKRWVVGSLVSQLCPKLSSWSSTVPHSTPWLSPDSEGRILPTESPAQPPPALPPSPGDPLKPKPVQQMGAGTDGWQPWQWHVQMTHSRTVLQVCCGFYGMDTVLTSRRAHSGGSLLSGASTNMAWVLWTDCWAQAHVLQEQDWTAWGMLLSPTHLLWKCPSFPEKMRKSIKPTLCLIWTVISLSLPWNYTELILGWWEGSLHWK